MRREQRGVADDRPAAAVGGDAPGREDHGTLAEFGGEREVVRDDEHRALERLEHLEQLSPRAGIEVGRRLVEHEQGRLHRQDGRDRHAPALAERELVRAAVCDVLHPHGAQRRSHAILEPRAGEPEVERPEGDVVAHRRHEELVVGILEDEADAGPQRLDVPVADVDPGHLEASLAAQEAVEVEHQGRLAGAVGSQHGDALPVGDVHVHAVERRLPVRVAVAQAARVDRAAHAATSAATRTATSTATSATGAATSTVRSRSGRRTGIVPLYPRASIAR